MLNLVKYDQLLKEVDQEAWPQCLTRWQLVERKAHFVRDNSALNLLSFLPPPTAPPLDFSWSVALLWPHPPKTSYVRNLSLKFIMVVCVGNEVFGAGGALSWDWWLPKERERDLSLQVLAYSPCRACPDALCLCYVAAGRPWQMPGTCSRTPSLWTIRNKQFFIVVQYWALCYNSTKQTKA